MPHNVNFSSTRIGRVDQNEVGPEVRLKPGCERGIGHHNHVLVESHSSIEFLAASLRKTRPDDAQHDLCLIQFLTGFRIKERGDALASDCWWYIDGKAVHGSQGLEAQSRDLIARIAV